jgi:lantibiotic biosynthesis protein
MEITTILPQKNKLKIFLDAATQIGDHLVRTAIWNAANTCCNWLGRKDIMDRQLAAYSDTNGTMTPEFYSGSSGIAFFLMELYHETADPAYRHTAIGGWLRSVQYIQQLGIPATPISFYAGDLGLLYIGYRFLQIDPTLKDTLKPYLSYLTGKVENGMAVKHGLDIIGGNAGAIAPLFRLAKENDLPSLATLAIACADEILERASWKDDLCFWDSPKVLGTEMDHPPLTGYSHGCAGLAAGLAAAYRETGNEAYLLHARGAFAFEHMLFNEDENNWIDTRYPHHKKDGKIYGTFRSAWCHGAPGIALAHITAANIDDDRCYYHQDMARRAIETTKKFLAQKLEEPLNDATLCHGFLGLSDILFTYGECNNDEESKAEARSFSGQYLNLHLHPYDMQSGIIAGGYSPSLLIGMAGVGLHYLRLSSERNIPSALFTME